MANRFKSTSLMAIFFTQHIRITQCYLRRTSATWEHDRHVHQDLNELFLVLKGCLNVSTPRGVLEARANSAVAYPKGLVHRPASRSDEVLEVIGMAWAGDIRDWEMAKLVQYDSLGRLRHQLLWMIDSLPNKQEEAAALNTLGRTVILEFNRLYDGDGRDLVVRVRRFMRDNLERPLALADLARCAGLSLHYFARAFKKVAGESPMRTLTTMRVEAARDLIMQTPLPLKYIATKTGFADETHLSHTFQRLVGYSPGSLRRSGKPTR
jgi:AraC-like DNA-binding protein/mannose-6-phosphate isomerase-like protein (cupin superfamily)